MSNASFYETITINYVGQNRNYATNLIKEAMEVSLAKDENKTVIYVGSHDWRFEFFLNFSINAKYSNICDFKQFQ